MARKRADRQRATSLANFLAMKFERLPLQGEWELAFGNPEFGGVWYVGGKPGNGKTSFLVQCIEMFVQLGKRVRFYNFEEQNSTTMQVAFRRTSLSDAEKKSLPMQNELMSFGDVMDELERVRWDVAVIDSVQKARFTAQQVERLRQTFGNRLLIISSHVQPNGLPQGANGNQVYREASLKVYCDRFRAISQGRYFGERGYLNIWEDKARELWAENV